MTEKQRYVLQGILDGKSQSEIARELGVSRQDIHNCAKLAISTDGKHTKFKPRAEAKYYRNLDAVLKRENLTCRAFNDRAGLKHEDGTVSRMLSHGDIPRFVTLAKIAKAAGMSVHELIDGREQARETGRD